MASIYLPPWRIDVTTRPGVRCPISAARLAREAAAALTAAGAPRPASLGLVLSDDRELAGLNSAHLGQRGPTDVLSFPLLELSAFPAHAGQDHSARAPARPAFALPPRSRMHLGDVVVSVERAIEQAEQGRGGQTGDAGWSAADELRLLVVHGVLHICGWDHAEAAEEAAMRAIERDLLAAR